MERWERLRFSSAGFPGRAGGGCAAAPGSCECGVLVCLLILVFFFCSKTRHEGTRSLRTARLWLELEESMKNESAAYEGRR